MKQDRPKPRTRKALSTGKKLAFSIAITTAFTLIVYVGSIFGRSLRLYQFVKDNQRGWRGRALVSDQLLGYSPMPGAKGLELVPLGQALPVRFDEDGFRIPLDGPGVGSAQSRSVLALGCSFTYGEVCRAEETYAGILESHYGYRAMNAGVTSYGLAQMLILARRLIPRHRPDYVIVQYSPWLVQRAQNFYAHLSFGTTPVPYFTETPGGELRIHPPVFRSKVTTLSVEDYRGTPRGLGDYLSFLFAIGGPLLLHDDYHIGIHRIRRIAGHTPAPAPDPQKIVKHVYTEISGLCERHGAKMLILILGHNHEPVAHGGLDLIPGARVVDAHAALLDRLPERTPSAFRAMYGHWKGHPPVLIDEHPNAVAHGVIAEEVAGAAGGVPQLLTDRLPSRPREARGRAPGTIEVPAP